MGTANFYTKNASKYFVVLMGWEDEETGDYVYPDEFALSDLKDNLRWELSKLGYQTDEGGDSDGTYIASKTVHKIYGDTEVGFTLRAVLRSGYYEGAVLDYELLDYEGYESDDVSDYLYNFEYQSNMPQGMQTIQRKYAESWSQRELQEQINKLEELFENWSSPYKKVAQFSNGETIYERLK